MEHRPLSGLRLGQWNPLGSAAAGAAQAGRVWTPRVLQDVFELLWMSGQALSCVPRYLRPGHTAGQYGYTTDRIQFGHTRSEPYGLVPGFANTVSMTVCPYFNSDLFV